MNTWAAQTAHGGELPTTFTTDGPYKTNENYPWVPRAANYRRPRLPRRFPATTTALFRMSKSAYETNEKTAYGVCGPHGALLGPFSWAAARMP